MLRRRPVRVRQALQSKEGGEDQIEAVVCAWALRAPAVVDDDLVRQPAIRISKHLVESSTHWTDQPGKSGAFI